MDMKKIGFALLVSLCIGRIFGQEKALIALRIGDTMPPVTLCIGHSEDTLFTPNDRKSHPTILGFWTPQCSFAASQLAVMEELQKEFPGNLRILPVGFDAHEEGSVQRYLADRTKKGGGIRIPVAIEGVQDSILYQLFPFVGLPLYIWIDSNKVIRGITDYLSFSEMNIRQFLGGVMPDLPLKYTDNSFDDGEPLLLNGNGGRDSAFIYRSLLLPYNPAVQMPFIEEKTERYVRIAAGNETPISLLLDAVYGINKNKGTYPYDPMRKRLQNKTVNLELFRTEWWSYGRSDYDKAEDMRKKQSFNYELILPPGYSTEEAYLKMLEDVSAFFRVKTTLVPQMVKGLALVVRKGKGPVTSKEGRESLYISDDGLDFKFQNCTLPGVVHAFNSCLAMPLIADRTHCRERVSFLLHLENKGNVQELARQLRLQGLDLTPSANLETMLVIKNR